jgi:hypothetical protein
MLSFEGSEVICQGWQKMTSCSIELLIAAAETDLLAFFACSGASCLPSGQMEAAQK